MMFVRYRHRYQDLLFKYPLTLIRYLRYFFLKKIEVLWTPMQGLELDFLHIYKAYLVCRQTSSRQKKKVAAIS